MDKLLWKRHRMSGKVQKTKNNTTICFHKKLTLNINHIKCLHGKAGMVLLTSDQTDFKPRSMIRDKKELFIMMKEHMWQKRKNPQYFNIKEATSK